MENKHSATPLRRCIYTLAQNGTASGQESQILVNGNGSDLLNTKAVKGRAKRKLITQITALSLMDAAKEKGKDEWKKPLWNTFYCQNKVITANGRLYGKYCKNRFCTLCCAIRKADIINKYLPVIKEWQEPYFVTLTMRAYKVGTLKIWTRKVLAGFRYILSKCKKRNQRGKGIKLVGIKSLECNYNPIAKTYNPHLHLIVENKAVAELLISEWLKAFTSKYTSRLAQHMCPIKDREKGLIEIVKYGSKIFTEPDVNKKSAQKDNREIYAAALLNIFEAMKGLRIFERFGFNLPKAAQKGTQLTYLANHDEWVFDSKSFDWFNTANDEKLTEYIPMPNLLELLNNRINLQAE